MPTEIALPGTSSPWTGALAAPMPHRSSRFRPRPDAVLVNGSIPLTWWTYAPNFGDLLAPFLVRAMTGLPVMLVDNYPHVGGVSHAVVRQLRRRDRFSYLTIGSIINRATDHSVVWGSGAFGTEAPSDLNCRATYQAVRGPLTRNMLRIAGIDCPDTFGDPALLMALAYSPPTTKKYKFGVVVRHSERERAAADVDDNVKVIDMRSADVEGTLADMLSCERLVSSSLHGLVLADAYNIPSAWLASTTPKGLEFKFYDYFLSVDKVRPAQSIDFEVARLTSATFDRLAFDDRPIRFDHERLIEACPFADLTG